MSGSQITVTVYLTLSLLHFLCKAEVSERALYLKHLLVPSEQLGLLKPVCTFYAVILTVLNKRYKERFSGLEFDSLLMPIAGLTA